MDEQNPNGTDRGSSSDELEPDKPLYDLEAAVMRLPARIGRSFKSNASGFATWSRNGAAALASFLRSPGTRIRMMTSQLRRELDRMTTVQLVSVLAAFMLFLVAPLVSVVIYSFTDQTTGMFSLAQFSSLLGDTLIWPFHFVSEQFYFFGDLRVFIYNEETNILRIQGWDLGAIFNSIYVAVLVTVFSVILGVFFAFLLARYNFLGKRIVRTVLIFPILATPFVGAIGVKSFLGLNGVFNNLFYDTLHWWPFQVELTGLAAIIMIQTLHFFSLVYLNAYSSFMGIDPSLEEQAENLGATGFRLFRSVTLPLAMPGIQAGAILTFILSIEDLGTPIIYSEFPQATKTLAYQVFVNIVTGSMDINPKGPALGMILLVFSLIGFMAIRKHARLRSYESGTKGGQWNPRVRRLTPLGTLAVYSVLVPLLFMALIPQISVLVLSFAGPWSTNSPLPDSWTTMHYSVLWAYPEVSQSIRFTLTYGLIATVIIVFLGTSAAYIIARRNIPGKSWFDMLVTSPIALPGIVIATGYFTLFYQTPLFPTDGPAFLIIMSYTIRKFPFTVRAAYAGLQSTPVVLEEASQNLGASKNKTFMRITMPLIGVSVLAGSLLSFVYSVSEVSTSIILGSLGRDQAPMTFWTKEILESHATSYSGANSAACLGVVMMVLQWIVITVTNRLLGARSSAITGI